MRVLIGTFIIFLFNFSLLANAQQVERAKLPEEKEHSFGFRVDPIWILIGGIGAESDVRLSKKTALGLGGYYIFPRSSTSDMTTASYKWSTYEVYLGPIFMLTGDYDQAGFYFAPAVGFTSARITDYQPFGLSGSMDAPELRLTVGYQWFSANLNNLKLTAGGGVRAIKSSDVVVNDSTGAEVVRQKSSDFGGLALDLGVGMIF